jgi:hypothetical protein
VLGSVGHGVTCLLRGSVLRAGTHCVSIITSSLSLLFSLSSSTTRTAKLCASLRDSHLSLSSAPMPAVLVDVRSHREHEEARTTCSECVQRCTKTVIVRHYVQDMSADGPCSWCSTKSRHISNDFAKNVHVSITFVISPFETCKNYNWMFDHTHTLTASTCYVLCRHAWMNHGPKGASNFCLKCSI